jgi:N-acetylmuramic acid 6-phosphate etherase
MPKSFRASIPEESRRTEQRNKASQNLDRMTAREVVTLMNREDRKVALAVEREVPAIARAVDAIVAGIRNGGRLIYVGAGSSGRMAVLDAAECQPTFGTPPELVQALIAGGGRAITQAVEGAEDDVRRAEGELRTRNLTRNDVVVGVTASGTTPFVLAALRYARGRGATTVAITSNRKTPVAGLAKIVIAAEVGPEVLTGSTRMKAGTAQKMVLNMLSTATMAQLGHVYENLMIDVVQTNEKVAKRALRILAEASGRGVSAAEHALRTAGHNMRVALVMLKLGVEAKEAKKRLQEAGENLRIALGEMSEAASDERRATRRKRGTRNG